jgi:hypothetical protein
MSAVLILTGSPGSGKSSVLDALSTLLEIDATVFAAIESERLARGWPLLALSDSLPQLAAITCLSAGGWERAVPRGRDDGDVTRAAGSHRRARR